MVRLSVWSRLVCLVALLRAALSLPGPWVGGLPPGREPFPAAIFLAIVLAFVATAGFLFVGGGNDRRARTLAVVFLLSGVPFTDGLLGRLAVALPGWETPLLLIRGLQVDAFLPYFLWAFVEEFPRVTVFGRPARLQRLGRRISLWAGATLLVASLLAVVAGLLGWPSPARRALLFLSRWGTPSAFYPLLFLLELPALGLAVWKSRRAPIRERRRVRLLLAGVLVGTLPTAVIILLKFGWPAFGRWILEPPGRTVIRAVAYPTLLAVPAVTAYAVLVRRALDVQIVVRKAVRYALARYTVLAGAAVPLFALLAFLWTKRGETLAQIVSGGSALVLLGVGGLGLVAMRVRGRALEAIDRLFFREQYDSTRLLRDLVERSRKVRDDSELARLLTAQIDRALHLESASFLCLADTGDRLVSPRGRVPPLPTDSLLARRVAEVGRPLEVEWERPGGLFGRLPADDQHWIAEGGYRMLVPLQGARGRLIGLLALGEKRSELPFTAEDREHLAAIAASAVLTLESRILGGGRQEAISARQVEAGRTPSAAERRARECATCGSVGESDANRCEGCGGAMAVASVPALVGGKYRVLARIGEGGMGVVYRGRDLNLGRDVAIKTLPRVSPRDSLALRAEARAMAAVSHPNLAQIFAAEFWRGTPLLIVEYFPAGTLAERLLERGPLPVPEAVELGRILADAAARIHEAGILHRDIKPSNIGYTHDGTPKLLDFGLAKMFQATAREGVPGRGDSEVTTAVPPVASDAAAPLPGEAGGPDTSPGTVVGTVGYLSPQAITGGKPDRSFDTWSIGVVLYEAVTGQNPFGTGGFYAVLGRILQGEFADVRELCPAASGPLAAFFRDVLSPDPARRPSTATELRRRLGALAREDELAA